MTTKSKNDTFAKWEQNGKLPEILEFIADCSRKLVTQKEMSKHLGICEDVFIRMNKKYPIIERVQLEAKLNLKRDLVGAIYKRAIGYENMAEVQHIEDGGKGKPPKRRIVKSKKHIPGDKYGTVYLFTKHFGREYSDKSYEFQLLEQKFLANKEEWQTPDEDNIN